jgi:hypothetical protein
MVFQKFSKTGGFITNQERMGDFRVGHMINFFDFSELPITPQDSRIDFLIF